MLNFPGSIIQTLLPYTCLLCNGASDQKRDLCRPCQKDLPAYHNGCPRCGVHLNTPNNTLPCGRCLNQPPPFHATHILFYYEPPVTHLLTRLKFHHHLTVARMLSEIFYDQIHNNWYRNKPYPDFLLPVPLHPDRLKERGYNQTLEIARPLAKRLHLPLWPDACIRTRPTLPQTTLSAKARRHNVQNAFQITRALRGAHLAIIEDVITTGSTLTSLCRTLIRSGARRIDIWCAARGMPVLPNEDCV